jgi:hypothetical protein
LYFKGGIKLYKCKKCGANLDAGEKCDCEEGAEIVVQETRSFNSENE